MTNPFYRTETGWATAPMGMGAPTAHAVTTHSAHFPAYQLCQPSEGG
ncbi:TPA: hypothetical protein PXR60_002043 [Yersinia enterocolitica]|nr:hypothetical protein [Yersinia enterocolitica]HDL8486434.1 hypothetical protein [Yersinia enterocolitica]